MSPPVVEVVVAAYSASLAGVIPRDERENQSLVGRYYDPATGQFLTVDPNVAQTGQPYAYTGDDPLNATDPLGLFCILGHTSSKKNSPCRGSAEAKKALKVVKKHAGALTKLAITAVACGGPQALLCAGADGLAKATHHTIAACISGSAGFGAGGVASGCAGFTGNGTPFASATVGAGGSSPVTELGAGVMFSNAQTPEDLRGPFGYGGGSADLGPGIGADGAVGQGTNNQSIWTGGASGQIGAADLFPFPLPVGFNGGGSYTWTTP